MGEILGNPGILGQGGYLVHPILGYSWDEEILGNPGILGQGGYLVYLILGCSRDGGDTWESWDTWTRGVSSSPNPRMLPGWGRYWGIPGYLDKEGI